MLIVVGTFDRDIEHADLGLIHTGTISREYYWLDRWYNVFRFHSPDGTLRNYYCNVSLPPTFEKGVLDYVDLDLDIVVWPDFTCDILDRDEYAANAVNFNYPHSVRSKVAKSMADLSKLIEEREFPFII